MDSGSPAALLQKDGGYVSKLALSASGLNSNGLMVIEEGMDDKDDETNDGHEPKPNGSLSARQLPDANAAPDNAEFLGDTRRKNGELSVYTYYLQSSGYAAVTLYAVSMALWIICTEFSSEYLINVSHIDPSSN